MNQTKVLQTVALTLDSEHSLDRRMRGASCPPLPLLTESLQDVKALPLPPFLYFNSPRYMTRGVAGLYLKRELLAVSIVNLQQGSI